MRLEVQTDLDCKTIETLKAGDVLTKVDGRSTRTRRGQVVSAVLIEMNIKGPLLKESEVIITRETVLIEHESFDRLALLLEGKNSARGDSGNFFVLETSAKSARPAGMLFGGAQCHIPSLDIIPNISQNIVDCQIELRWACEVTGRAFEFCDYKVGLHHFQPKDEVQQEA